MAVGSMVPKAITFQVADIHRPLLSIAACADAGFDYYLGKQQGHLIVDKPTRTIRPYVETAV